jgi:hypothetical protein
VDLERGSLSLVRAMVYLLERKSSSSGLENREYDRRDSPRWPLDILYLQKLALTSQTNGGSSVGTVHSQIRPRSLFYITKLCQLYVM